MPKGSQRASSRAQYGFEDGLRRVRYPLVNTVVTVAAAGAGAGFGNVTIGKLPEGNVLIAMAGGVITFTTADTDLTTTWDGNVALGTAADADGTLAGTEVNIMASNAVGPATSRTITAALVGGVTPAQIKNPSNNTNVILNMIVSAAAITDAQSAPITMNGFIDVFLAVAGDA